jgi:hypothetical protein
LLDFDAKNLETWKEFAKLYWLMLWNNFIFPYIGKFMIPTDELHDFSEGSRRVG